MSWTIRLAADGSEANSGSTSDLLRGAVTVSANLKSSTAYRVTGRLVLPRRTTETQTVTVTTLDLGILRDELDEELRDTLADFEEFVGEVPGLIAGEIAAVNADIDAVNNRLTSETADLSGDVADARQLALDNLLVAQNYTNTSVTSESVARQLKNGQLAARINEITAANTSNNMLVNPDFADGTTGWTGVTVANGKGTVTAAGAAQSFDVTFGVAEMLQWRIEVGGPAGSVRIGFLTAAGALIGSEIPTSFAASPTAKVASGQHAPPENAAQVRFRVVGAGVEIDNAAVTKIDQQIVARIQELEVAMVTDEQALATHRQQTNTRFGQNEADLIEERTARSTADTALAQRATALETTTADHAARITVSETTLSNAEESIAQIEQLAEAESGRQDISRDGTFLNIARYWTGGALPVSNRVVPAC